MLATPLAAFCNSLCIAAAEGTFSVMSSVYANIPNKFPTAWFVSDIAIFVVKRDVKLQLTNSNCMAVLCGMPTIQYSDRSALLCALALYFVHLMRPKIQGLVSRDTIVDCQFVTAWAREWVTNIRFMRRAVPSTVVRHRRKLWRFLVRSVQVRGITMNWFQR